ncbi:MULTISPECIES: SOS response-associated peptidase [unclassified Roseateles]|uniref:SOS response-associated peptidase n=1 Tax=unclassified Roseateles TaxID=2626991 RepID=UPI0006FFD6F2|nr:MULTISPECIES: SOS response-associated peptidase family protein [unclassified Roseateles]KQW51209.1 hypothetical protein ASC81_00705 [Pelomonas sp. Root405]KRA77441.1 hypothetical protein ASD88_00705 [Pelomonas sp. Root662]
MCSNYKPVTLQDRLLAHFGVVRPDDASPPETYVGFASPFIIRDDHKAELAAQCVSGQFGLVPEWAEDLVYGRKTYNCRTETMRTKASFKEAWFSGHRCVIPAELLYEDNWESGDPVRWAVKQRNGDPMAVAGLWGMWRDQHGIEVLSFTMLTVNADGHGVYDRLHEPGFEKRMPVILRMEDRLDWLYCPVADAGKYLQRFPAELLETYPEPAPWKKLPEPASWANAPDMFEDEWRDAAVDPEARMLKARRFRPKSKAPAAPESPPPTTGDLFD